MATIMWGCGNAPGDYGLISVEPSYSNIHFNNTIMENDSVNVVLFQYCYNGGGVGIGDFNNDGLPDIVFGGNQVSSKLYLNKGSLKFQDISALSGFITESWVTGVSIVDINNDGLDDIYLSVGGAACNLDCFNLLFVNQGLDKQGIPHFKEQAKLFGLEDGNYAQQTVFFDYDNDGDLDAFILHNGNSGFDKNNPVPKKYLPPHLQNILLRNDSIPGLEHPYFTDISKVSQIKYGGFGLGLGINDFNGDGLTDIYIANDFITDDLLYVQQRHKDSIYPWFREEGKQFTAHQTYNAMGVDIADINNNGLPDILVLDMLPQNHIRQKKMLGSMNYEKFLLSQRNGYSAQYVRNTLQINNGQLNGRQLKASEVAYSSGLASTDWSWSPLMLDLDNDGDKDIYISNGYAKDVADLDYANYTSQNNMFGTEEEKLANQFELAKNLKQIHLPNYIFENLGDLRFRDVSEIWTTPIPSFSNGVAYADLDLDGDLDLVINNINETAMVLENKISENKSTHYFRIRLEGNNKNKHAIGAKVTLWQQGNAQHHFQSVIRGYLSSVEPVVHFGVIDAQIDSVAIEWPNGKNTVLKNQIPDQTVSVNIISGQLKKPSASTKGHLFKQVSDLLEYTHSESNFNEYALQPLLMKQYSQSGPCIASANIDGIPGHEIFIGGSKGFPGQLWAQDHDGSYKVVQNFDFEFEDTDALFMDVNGDGHPDLFVTSGGTEFPENSENYQDRIYLNDGKGKLFLEPSVLPTQRKSSNIVRACDYDRDGNMDFFIGSGSIPGKYPLSYGSTLLQNENGKLTEQHNENIEELGMVTDAIWEDIDADGWTDLIIVGHWMPILVFKNDFGVLRPMPLSWKNENDQAIKSAGWWNCIVARDFDNDGDLDFIIGNQGLNQLYRPRQNEPIVVYKNDYDKNGSPDPVIGVFYDTSEGRKLMPLQARDNIMSQLPMLKKNFLTYESFAKTSFLDLLKITDLMDETLQAYIFESSYAENLGNGNFRLTPLGSPAQVSPINSILVNDFDSDGNLDALLGGNDNSAETIYGKFDALNGIFMKGKTKGFNLIASSDSGFYVPGQANKMILSFDKDGKPFVVVPQNNGKLLNFVFD